MNHLILERAAPTPVSFSLSEWESLRLDGLVRPYLLSSWAPSTFKDSPAHRARAAGLLIAAPLRPRVVIGWASAAWVHGWSCAPSRLELLIDRSSRTTSAHRMSRDLLIHEVLDPLDHSVNFSQVYVSDRVRTVFDVARYCNDEDAHNILHAALKSSSLREMVRDYPRINHQRVPQRHRSRMRARIISALASPQELP